jgi:hypothetical protein
VPVLGNGDIFSAPTRSRWSTAPAATASWSAGAAWVGRGCSATWRPRSPGARCRRPRRSAGRGDHAPARRAPAGAHGRGQGHPRHAQAHRLVPQGLPGRPEVRRRLGLVDGLDELDELLAGLDPHEPFPADADGPRGRQGSPGRVVLPERWLDDPDDASVPLGAELEHSGG